MIDVIVVPSSFERTAAGSISGVIFLRGAAGDFPDSHWSDFPAVVLAWWIAGLRELVAGHSQAFTGRFMDGPLVFVIERREDGSGRLSWGSGGSERAAGIVGLADLLSSVVSAGEVVARVCRVHHWTGSDLECLERELFLSRS